MIAMFNFVICIRTRRRTSINERVAHVRRSSRGGRMCACVRVRTGTRPRRSSRGGFALACPIVLRARVFSSPETYTREREACVHNITTRPRNIRRGAAINQFGINRELQLYDTRTCACPLARAARYLVTLQHRARTSSALFSPSPIIIFARDFRLRFTRVDRPPFRYDRRLRSSRGSALCEAVLKKRHCPSTT